MFREERIDTLTLRVHVRLPLEVFISFEVRRFPLF